MIYHADNLNDLALADLKSIAEQLLIPKTKIAKTKKPDLIELILKKQEMNKTDNQELLQDQTAETKTEENTETDTTESGEKRKRARIPKPKVEKVEAVSTLGWYRDWEKDRKSTRLNSSHSGESRMPSSA